MRFATAFRSAGGLAVCSTEPPMWHRPAQQAHLIGPLNMEWFSQKTSSIIRKKDSEAPTISRDDQANHAAGHAVHGRNDGGTCGLRLLDFLCRSFMALFRAGNCLYRRVHRSRIASRVVSVPCLFVERRLRRGVVPLGIHGGRGWILRLFLFLEVRRCQDSAPRVHAGGTLGRSKLHRLSSFPPQAAQSLIAPRGPATEAPTLPPGSLRC